MSWAQQKVIQKGANMPTEAELLDVITGVNGVGEDIIEVFGGFRGRVSCTSFFGGAGVR